MNEKGTTFIELLVVVIVLGLAAAMAALGGNFLRDLLRQRALIDVQRQVQVSLYQVTRDIRNATDIVAVSSDTLVLLMADVRKGYDTTFNPNLFEQNNISSVTYQYQKSGNIGYLNRRVATTLGTVVVDNKKLLPNLLIEPSTNTYIFKDAKRPFETAVYPYDSIEITFRVKPVFNRGGSLLYRAESMKRAPSPEQ